MPDVCLTMFRCTRGIYIFNTRFLLQHVNQDAADPESSHDFGKNIIPKMVAEAKVYDYLFSGYWVDVGTISSYWETNLALRQPKSGLDLYDPSGVIHTRSKERPPLKLGSAEQSRDSLVSNGCVIDGVVVNSILSPGVMADAGVTVRDSIIHERYRDPDKSSG